MWTLWIISTVIGSTEPKYTRYAEFEHWWECQDAWRKVSMEFTQEEIAFCEDQKTLDNQQIMSYTN